MKLKNYCNVLYDHTEIDCEDYFGLGEDIFLLMLPDGSAIDIGWWDDVDGGKFIVGHRVYYELKTIKKAEFDTINEASACVEKWANEWEEDPCER